MNLKTFYKFLLMFFIFFSFNDIVLGANELGHPDLFGDCTVENKCIPICVYGHENDNGDTIDYAYVGYYYDIDRRSTNPNDTVWEIGYSYEPDSSGNIYDPAHVNLINSNVSWEVDYPHFNKTSDNPSLYVNLINNFKCPMYVAGGIFGDLSFQFTNTTGYNKLTYSFGEELGKVLDITYYNMKDILLDNLGSLHSNPDFISYGALASMSGFPKENELEILSMHDSNIKYSSNLSYEENLKQNKICEYFNGKDTSSYISELVELSDSEHLYGDKIHEKIKFVANNIDVRNKSVYDDYFNLRFLIDYNSKTVLNSNKHNGKTFTTKNGFVYDMAYDRLNVMLTVPPKKALDNVINTCKSLYPSYDFSSLDSSELFDEYTTQMESILYKKNAVIDLESTFDCGSFLSGNLAKMIGNAYFIIEIGSLLIFIALSILDYAKVILNGDQDEMKKTNKNTIIRLIIVVSLFLLPAIINFVLGIFNIEGFDSKHPLCVEIKNK